jgi:hypothetical protein
MRALFWMLILLPMTGRGADSPEQAALHFAEGLRDGLDKEQLTLRCSLNPETGDRKKDAIQEAWRGIAKKMLTLPFQVADQKTDGDDAAVVLLQFDPERGKQASIVSFAVVKRDQTWLAAPVVSSFQNSVVTYDPSLLDKRRSLENWMLGREISIREETSKKADQYLAEMMRKSIDAESLRNIKPDELLRDLIQACRDRNQAGVLARLGGYSVNSIPAWDGISRKISQVFTSDALHAWPWNLLIDPRTLSAMGETLDLVDEQTIDIAFLHPDSLNEEPQHLTFTLLRDDQGLMRVELPEVFLAYHADENDDTTLLDFEDAANLALYEKLRHEARAALDGIDSNKSESLAGLIEKSLKMNDFSSFWGAAAKSGADVRANGMASVVSLWRDLQGKNGSSLFGRVGFLEGKNQALLVMQSYSPRNADGAQLQKIWLQRENDQWSMQADIPDEEEEELDKWYNDHTQNWEKDWALALVGDAARIQDATTLANHAPEPGKVREAFDFWVRAVQDKCMAKVVAQCATFDDNASIIKMLRTLSGELIYGSGSYEVLNVEVAGRWGGVSVKQISDKPNSAPQYPLFVFVGTEKGPRLLSQVELKLTTMGNRSREFLNEIAFKDLSKRLPNDAIGELRSLYDKHCNLVRKKDVIKQ